MTIHKRSDSSVMIVEDEIVTALDLEEYLESLGYVVAASVSSGEEAIDLLDKTKPDMVLLDINLAGAIDGIETAQLIKAKVNIPIIFISAYYDEDRLEKALSNEPYGFICKPFNKRDIKITMKMALHMSKLNVTRIEANRKLQESEEKIRRLSENLADGMVYQINSGADGLKHDFSYLSPSIERLHGLRVEDVQNNPMLLYNQVIEADRTWVAIQEAHAVSNQIPLKMDVQVKLPSGEICWRRFISSPRKDTDGQILWDGIEIDITDQKQKELELEESERKYRFIAEESLQGIAIVAGHPKPFIYVNPMMTQLWGYSREEFLAFTFDEHWMLYHPNDILKIQAAALAQLKENNGTHRYQFRAVRKDGQYRWMVANSNQTKYDGKNVNIVIFTDVTN
ncbi:MAG: PAS domain-containing protein [Desulfatirhabdiaceae bacterium]